MQISDKRGALRRVMRRALAALCAAALMLALAPERSLAAQGGSGDRPQRPVRPSEPQRPAHPQRPNDGEGGRPARPPRPDRPHRPDGERPHRPPRDDGYGPFAPGAGPDDPYPERRHEHEGGWTSGGPRGGSVHGVYVDIEGGEADALHDWQADREYWETAASGTIALAPDSLSEWSASADIASGWFEMAAPLALPPTLASEDVAAVHVLFSDAVDDASVSSVVDDDITKLELRAHVAKFRSFSDVQLVQLIAERMDGIILVQRLSIGLAYLLDR